MDDQRPHSGPVRLCKRPPGLGWDPLERADWEQVAAALTLPWPAGAVRADLRYWASLERLGRAERPSVRRLAVRWGLSEKAARTMVADTLWWEDQSWTTNAPKPPDAPETHSGRTPDAPETHSGRTPDAPETHSGSLGAPQSTGSDALRTHPRRTPDAPETHSGRTPDALRTHPPVRVGGGGLFSGLLTETETETETGTETPKKTHCVEGDPPPRLPPLPEWGAKLRLPSHIDRRALVGAVLRTVARVVLRPLPPEWDGGYDYIREMTGRTIAPEAKTDSASVLALWRALGMPDPVQFEADAARVAWGFHNSTHPIYARNVRAEGWKGGIDRSRSVATFCVQEHWEERLSAVKL
jgi:hypothetical protein